MNNYPCIEYNVSYGDENWFGGEFGFSVATCQSECRSNPSCNYFSFFNGGGWAHGRCFMYSSAAGKQSESSMISGPGVCL